MNAELIKKEVAAVCNRKIARLSVIRNDLKLRPSIRRRAELAIFNLQDIRYRWCESWFLDRCQQRIKEEQQEQREDGNCYDSVQVSFVNELKHNHC